MPCPTRDANSFTRRKLTMPWRLGLEQAAMPPADRRVEGGVAMLPAQVAMFTVDIASSHPPLISCQPLYRAKCRCEMARPANSVY